MAFFDPIRCDPPPQSDVQGDQTGPVAAKAQATLHLLVSGTRIATPQGEVEVDRIARGDTVTTRLHGPQRVEAPAPCTKPRLSLIVEPRLTPVAIGVGALGHGLPAQPIWLHPLSRIVAGPPGAQPRRACDLVGDAGVVRVFPNGVTYVALRLPAEAQLQVAGVWLGPQGDVP
jgi:hypothetical protein